MSNKHFKCIVFNHSEVVFNIEYTPLLNDYLITQSLKDIYYFSEYRHFKRRPENRGVPKYFNSINHNYPQPLKNTKIKIHSPDDRIKSNLYRLKNCKIDLSQPLFKSGLLSKLKTILGNYTIE